MSAVMPTDAAGPDRHHGLPLIRARSAFVSVDFWRPALVASIARANKPSSESSLLPRWRYEVFFVPAVVPPEDRGPRWGDMAADPLLRAEAERQDTFYAVSLELGRRLIAGELRGFGRDGSVAGPWITPPREAWRILRVPFSGDFLSWQLGHVIGGGLDLWDVRIVDLVGLPLTEAALAYGPPEQAAIIQEATALGTVVAGPPRRSRLDAAMAGWFAWYSIVRPLPVTQKDREAAEAVLNDALLRQLRSGELIAETPDGRVIRRREWSAWGLIDAVELLGAGIRVRHSAVASDEPDTASHGRGRNTRQAPKGAFFRWARETGSARITDQEADDWAKEHSYSTGSARRLAHEYNGQKDVPKTRPQSRTR